MAPPPKHHDYNELREKFPLLLPKLPPNYEPPKDLSPNSMANAEVEFVVRDARELMCKISSGDNMLEDLIRRVSAISGQVNCLKEYQATLDAVSAVTSSGPKRAILLNELQHETNLIESLAKENENLRATTIDTFKVMRHLLDKYKEAAKKVKNMPKLPEGSDQLFDLVQQEKERQSRERAKKREFAYKMQEFIALTEANERKTLEWQAQIMTENKGLKEMLEISNAGNPGWKKEFERRVREKRAELRAAEEEDSGDDTEVEDNANVTAIYRGPPETDAGFSTDDLNGSVIKLEKSTDDQGEDSDSSSDDANNTILRRPAAAASSPSTSSS